MPDGPGDNGDDGGDDPLPRSEGDSRAGLAAEGAGVLGSSPSPGPPNRQRTPAAPDSENDIGSNFSEIGTRGGQPGGGEFRHRPAPADGENVRAANGFAIPPRTASLPSANRTKARREAGNRPSLLPLGLLLAILLHLSLLPRSSPPPPATGTSCFLAALPRPLRIVDVPLPGPQGGILTYPLALHPPGNDIYLSDPLFDALIADRPHPFRDLHLRFVAAAARATDRYGHPSAASAVDVGAHLGIHAVTLRALGFRVLAAEPHPASHRLLECNGAFRPPLGAGNLTLLRAAVTSHPPPAPGTLHLSTPYPSNIGHSLLVPSPDPTSTPVALTSLDELSRLLPALPWLLKVSAEGHEPAILSRTSVLRSPATRPRYIAVHMDAPSMLRDAGRGGAEPESLFAALFGNGYRLFARLPGGMDRVDKAHAAHGVLKGDREVVLGGADLRGVVREGGWLWAVHGDEIGGSQGEE